MSSTIEDFEKINKLAATLRSCGVAPSREEAERMARRMLGKPEEERLPTIDELEPIPRPEKSGVKVEIPKQDKATPSYDITKETRTLLELMQEDAEEVYKQALLKEDEKDLEFVQKKKEPEES